MNNGVLLSKKVFINSNYFIYYKNIEVIDIFDSYGYMLTHMYDKHTGWITIFHDYTRIEYLNIKYISYNKKDIRKEKYKELFQCVN